MFKRYLLLGTAIVTLGIFSDALAQAFRYRDDADIPQWGLSAVERVREEDIMTGFGDGTFKPYQELNRAEALVLILRTKGIDFEDSGRVKNIEFSDVSRGEWFAGAVVEATTRGWIEGFPDGTFRPGKVVNRAEWATLLKRAFELEKEENPGFEDVPEGIWFAEPIFNLAANDLIRERSSRFDPSGPVSRVDAAWTIGQILEKPRLMGESKDNEFSSVNRRDARRTAIKPRDFNPNKQGFDIEKKQLSLDVNPKEEDIILDAIGENWVDFGTIRAKNTLEDRVTLHSLEFKLRFESTNQGPPSSFVMQLKN
ncbi:S-layer homology domain-containing protein, partial [Candidatus Gracilibacteria bacterium]|nr:S-layer homology domain-containing protein [Candidatus Gracilibacteria bacterium]